MNHRPQSASSLKLPQRERNITRALHSKLSLNLQSLAVARSLSSKSHIHFKEKQIQRTEVAVTNCQTLWQSHTARVSLTATEIHCSISTSHPACAKSHRNFVVKTSSDEAGDRSCYQNTPVQYLLVIDAVLVFTHGRTPTLPLAYNN